MAKTDIDSQLLRKGELASHLSHHPEWVYPPYSVLRKWRKDELIRAHDELHEAIIRARA